MRQKQFFLILLLMAVTIALSCRKGKNDPGGSSNTLSYGNPIIYPTGDDQVVSPVNKPNVAGRYSAFPEGLELDEATGEIDVEDSETGLRYRITFTPDDGSAPISTTVLLAGINYMDAFHVLANNDSIARVIYNGDPNNPVPVSIGRTVFDVDNECSEEGIAINKNDGSINLAQTIRNGFFGRHPDNDTREEFELEYMIDDGTKRTRQEIKIKLYYHNTIDDIDDDLLQLVKNREGTLLREDGTAIPQPQLVANTTASIQATGRERPRPPCIFIIGR